MANTFLTYEQIVDICSTINKKHIPTEDSFLEIIDDLMEAHYETKEPSEIIMLSFQSLLKNVDSEINMIEENMDISPNCAKGCAFCCYYPIIITRLEAKLIVQWIKQSDEHIQKEITDHLTSYFYNNKQLIKNACEINYEENDNFKEEYILKQLPCPFLDTSTNSCKIYEVRPMPCRTYLNYSDPKACENSHMPKEPFSYHFLEGFYMSALNEQIEEFLYEGREEELPIRFPDDVLEYGYLPVLIREELKIKL